MHAMASMPTAGGSSSPIPPAPVRRGRPLTDRAAVALAAATAAGAWTHAAVPRWPGALLVAIALAARRPWLLVVGAALLASALGVRAIDGLRAPAAGPFAGPVTLVADPQPMPFGAHVDVRARGHRFELWASGAAAGTVEHALAGERLTVSGRVRPPAPGSSWLVPRHVIGRIDATHADALDAGAPPWAAANRFRRLLDRGAAVIPEPSRSLYSGFVLGDDRGQPPEIVDDFRGSGLTHLLVVSGENVAFVLVLAGPLLRRRGLVGRWVLTVLVIVAFATVTRFEPSVLRASAMAVVAASAALAGRPTSTMRALALAVTALLLVDPLLVQSVGFQLSVAASVGISMLATRVGARLPGPRFLAEALGVTIAAQLGVAPVLVPRFGGLPVVALAANVLAVPVAGLVTTWGLPAGVVAGLAGKRVAAIAHIPTRLCVAWVATVARVSSSVPLGELDMPHLVVAVVGGCLLLGQARHRGRRIVGGAVLALALLSPAIALHRPPFAQAVASGALLYRSGGAAVLVSDGHDHPADLLEGLRRGGARRLDVVVIPGGQDADLVAVIRLRRSIGQVVDTDGGPRAGSVGPLRIEVDVDAQTTVSQR
jgi:competence protein ComEC